MTYEVVPVGIYPGTRFRVEYFWGSSTGMDGEMNGNAIAGDDVGVSVSGLALDFDFYTFDLAENSLYLTINWHTEFWSYEATGIVDPASGLDLTADEDTFALPFGLRLQWLPITTLRLDVFGGYDIPVAFITYLGLEAEVAHEYGVAATWVPYEHLSVGARLKWFSQGFGSQELSRKVDGTDALLEVAWTF